MRIQHNIMAMNAYNQYNKNTKALSANLEKLSSGYRINRAGDDAAGLAISEKMRAQITGLDAAQKNVKDGISLVKTAEGAMQEIHDMLNKMTYLATQSANGTYQDEVDRENLQKEVNSIKEEINRIADSANFNGIKLLDGSLDSEVKTTSGKGRMIQEQLGAGENPIDQVGKKTMLDGAAVTPTNTKFTVDFTGMEAKAKGDAGTPAKYSFQVTGTSSAADGDTLVLGGQNLSVKDDGTGDITSTDTTDLSKVATALAAKLNANNVDPDYTITADGDKIVYTAKKNGLVGGGAGQSGPTAAPTDIETTTASRGLQIGAMATEDAGTEPAAGATPEVTFKIGGVNVTAAVTLNDGDTATDIATAVHGALTTTGKATIGGKTFSVTDNNDGTLTFELDGDPADVPGNYDWDLTVTGGSIEGAHTAGTSLVTPGSAGQAAAVANTVFKIEASDLTDGTEITLDGTTIKLAVGANSTVTGGTVVQLTDADLNDMNMALSKISAAFNGSTTNFIVGMNDTSNTDVQAGLTVHKKATSTETYDTMEKLGAVFSIKGASGSELTLQIGEDSEDYNQMKVSIGDMHVTAMGGEGGTIADVDIGTQAGAQAAVQVIKDAINYVSSARGDLGAIQNRLDHTGNNLAVMEENIQDAESTIRDTDVAEEMMAYVKNNILVQSAQAMLAQANQVPQGVLQLLG